MIYLVIFFTLMITGIIFFSYGSLQVRIGSKLINVESTVYWFYVIILTCILGFRGMSGTDTWTYQGAYSNLSAYQYFESGYRWLSLEAWNSGLSFEQFQILMAFITMFLFALAYSISVSNTVMALFFFVGTGVYYTLFNTMRQGMAEALFLLAVILFYRLSGWKKYIVTGILIYLAYLFHVSVIVVVIMWILSAIAWNIFGYRVQTFTILISLLGILGVRIPVSKFSNLFSQMGLSYIDSYSEYLGDINYGLQGTVTILIFVAIVFLIGKREKIFSSKIGQISYVLFLLYLITSSVFGYVGLMNRFLNYFVPFFPILFVDLINNSRLKDRKASIQLLIIFYLIIFMLYTLVGNYQGILPYRP